MMAETILVFSIISLLTILVFLYVLRTFRRYRKIKDRFEKDTTEVGFVVNTFHDLVSKLKEKEKELETLKKIAEERAENIESYNKNILQSVPSGVISFDRDLNIKSINLSAEKILGLKSTVSLGKGYQQVLSDPIAGIVKDGKPVEREEVQYQTSDGRKIWLGLNLSILRDTEGKEIGHILVFTDLTALKAFEAQAELRKRLSSLGEMSAGIAHELRNPLGVIAGYTKLLSKKVDNTLIPTVDAISKEVEVMDRIISDFLSFARPVELNISQINLYDIINSCVSSMIYDSKTIDVFINIDKSLSISGDEVLLRQAFTNLIQNAAEAMKDGGKLRFDYKHIGNYIEIVVSDTGHGIPEGIRNKIFLPFYTTKERGTGLGLAIVHKTIVSHGGEILVESANAGTTFRLRLPVNNS